MATSASTVNPFASAIIANRNVNYTARLQAMACATVVGYHRASRASISHKNVVSAIGRYVALNVH